MKNIKKLKNNLDEILEEKKMSKKELAEKTDQFPAAISDFSNQVRSTYNVSLLESIMDELDVEVEDLLKRVDIVEFETYRPGTYYLLDNRERKLISYLNNPNNAYLQTVQGMENKLITSKVVFTKYNMTVEGIQEWVNLHKEISLDEMDEDEIMGILFDLVQQHGTTKVEVLESEKFVLAKLDMLLY